MPRTPTKPPEEPQSDKVVPISKATTKRTRRATPMTGISHEKALVHYLALGESRSIHKLWESFQEKNITVSENTLNDWRSNYGWVAAAADFDQQQAQALLAEISVSQTEMDARHIRMARAGQRLVDKELKRLVEDEEFTLAPDLLPRYLEVFAKMERLAAGAATNRVDNTMTYNMVIMPVLALFQQIVGGLPETVRNNVVRQFADGVNDIRDALLGPIVDGEVK